MRAISPALKSNALRSISGPVDISQAVHAESGLEQGQAAHGFSWQPRQLRPSPLWSRYRALFRVDRSETW